MLITTSFVNAGCQGRIFDRGGFTKTQLYINLETKTLGLPQPVPLNGREKSVPHFFVGDEAFPLSKNLMKVYLGQHPKGSKERISITGSAQPEGLKKMYLDSRHQCSKYFVNLCFWNQKKPNSM